MKKYTFLLLLTLLLNCCTTPPKKTAKIVLESLFEKNAEHSSISYHIKFKIKFFNKKDTTNFQSDCKLIKNKKDTLFNGYVWYNVPRWHFIYYFNLDHLYCISDSLKIITAYNDPKYEYWNIRGNISGDMINTLFLDTLFSPKELPDTILNDNLSKDVVGNNEYWKITIKYKANKEISNEQRCVLINPIDSTLRKITYKCTFQGKEEYEEWDIDSIQYDIETPQTLKALMQDRFSRYELKPYIPPNPQSEKTLDNGKKAPVFYGIDLATGKKIFLTDYKGKILLLDFWYMDCIWCTRAMPLIEKMRDEFSNKGLVVLGINSHDTSVASKAELPKFIRINKNNYPTILTSPSTDKSYNIYAYPTIYLINKKGEIVFSDIGYRKSLDSTLEAEIKKTLIR